MATNGKRNDDLRYRYRHPSVGYIVSCESTAAIVLHARRVEGLAEPIRLSGHSSPQPRAVCGSEIAWDTERPATAKCITCRSCRKALGWPEKMEKTDA